MSLYSLKRRDFIKTSAGAVAGLALSRSPLIGQKAGAKQRKRYAIVGVGVRSQMYQDAIEKRYAEHARLVGICDTNPGRLELSQRRSKQNGSEPAKAYAAEAFEAMIREQRPEVVIVTTIDGVHHEYIVRAMELGCDTITEKPMTIDAAKCQQIIDAQRRTGKKCTVTFNYRYSPPRTQVKDILMSGAIGQILSVDFHWLLNTYHGADYFRRWHSRKDISGGLMVHKATHHFDLVNWWLGAIPTTVQAIGKRQFYTPEMGRRMGLESHHERCLTCPEAAKCGFYHNLRANKGQKELYLDNEHHDGYFRDQCVWRPEIDIEDTMNVQVLYDNNVTLSYSLNAFNAWEGYEIAFNGTGGRLEHSIVEQVYVSGTDTVQGGIKAGGVKTTLIPIRGEPQEIEPWSGAGSHGGGDRVMLDQLFLPNAENDKYLRSADQISGAYSILTGAAANECFRTGKPVNITDMVKDIGYPEYPPMAMQSGPLPMPERVR